MTKQLWPRFVRPRIRRHRKFLIFSVCIWMMMVGAIVFWCVVLIAEEPTPLGRVGLFEVLSIILSIFYFPVVLLIFVILALSPSRPQLHRGFDLIFPRENTKLGK